MLELIAVKGEMIESPSLIEQVCSDKDDDKFIACAVASTTRIIVSGDRALLKVSGCRGITIVNPAQFIAQYLK